MKVAIVYIETSIIGYLTARTRNDVIFHARQELTRSWWESSREDYELVTSQLVLDEASAGDADAAAERLKLLVGIPLLASSDPQVDSLADALLSAHLLPAKARSDAEHVCGRDCSPGRLLNDVELQAHRQRGDDSGSLSTIDRQRMRSSIDCHARAVFRL